jgi:hypothetical protein
MRRTLTWSIAAMAAGAVLYGVTAVATPSYRFSGRTEAIAQFDEMDVNSFTLPANIWQARLRTRGKTLVYLQSNTWERWDGVGPVPSTGWHTHPGPSLIMVVEGTITAYDSDDPSCSAHTYTQGEGFVDHGGDHAHVIRNESTETVARTMAFQLFPDGTRADQRRVDRPSPAGCDVQ